jgi:hypothetical protein
MTTTTDFYTLALSVHQQLRALNTEFRATAEALNQSQASLTRAMRLLEDNYQRKRKAILDNGHDQDVPSY